MPRTPTTTQSSRTDLEPNADAESDNEHDSRGRLATLGVLSLVLAAVLASVAGPAAGTTATTIHSQANNTTTQSNLDENSEYYNESSQVANETWFAGIGDASLDSLGQMATRAVTFFIGTGELDPSGTGYQGVLLTGIVMAASMVAAVAGIGVGPVGGSVFAVVIGYGLTEVGLAPTWFRVLLLFALGIIAFVAFNQSVEGR